MAHVQPVSSPSWPTRSGRSLLLVCVSALVALGLCEGALWLFPGLLPEDVQLRLVWNNRSLDPQLIADPHLGFRYPPKRTLVLKSRDFTMTIQTDEHGLRNKSPWPERASVVVVGDSLAFGYGVDDAHMWSRLIEARLPTERVVNISLPGLAPEQYFRYFERFGAPLQPQLVILCVFPGNDVADAKRFEVWQAAGSPGNFAEWRYGEMSELPRASRPRESPSLLERSRLAMALTAIRNNLSSRFQSETLSFPEGRVQLVPGVYEKRMSTFNDRDPGFRALVESVRNTRALTDRLGARLLVVLFPTKEEVYLPGRGAEYPHMVEAVKHVLDELPVDTFDLTDGLRRHANEARPLFFEVDGHPNDRGNAVIANLILRRLQQERLRDVTSQAGTEPP